MQGGFEGFFFRFGSLIAEIHHKIKKIDFCDVFFSESPEWSETVAARLKLKNDRFDASQECVLLILNDSSITQIPY